MPKMKTKSSAKKRFSLTSTGKVRHAHAYKRHNLRRRQQRTIRNLRGTDVMNDADARIVKKFLPYG